MRWHPFRPEEPISIKKEMDKLGPVEQQSSPETKAGSNDVVKLPPGEEREELKFDYVPSKVDIAEAQDEIDDINVHEHQSLEDNERLTKEIMDLAFSAAGPLNDTEKQALRLRYLEGQAVDSVRKSLGLNSVSRAGQVIAKAVRKVRRAYEISTPEKVREDFIVRLAWLSASFRGKTVLPELRAKIEKKLAALAPIDNYILEQAVVFNRPVKQLLLEPGIQEYFDPATDKSAYTHLNNRLFNLKREFRNLNDRP